MFENGDVVIKQGDEGDSFFVLEEGTAVASVAIPNPNHDPRDPDSSPTEEKDVAAYSRGGFFGELALLDKAGGKRRATVRATSRISCATLDRPTFQSIVSTLEGLQDRFDTLREEYTRKAEAARASSTDGGEGDGEGGGKGGGGGGGKGQGSASESMRANASAMSAVAAAEERERKVEAAYAAASSTGTSAQARKQLKPIGGVIPPPFRGTLQAPKARDVVPKIDEWDSAAAEMEAKVMETKKEETGHGRFVLPFSSSFGAPTVFVTKPPPLLICPMCMDVLLDPVLIPDGTTTCRKCAPMDQAEAYGGVFPPDEAALQRVHDLPILCAHALKQVEHYTKKGVKYWVLDEEGCRERVRFADRDAHEKHCTYRHVTCQLPGSHIPHHNCTMRLRFFQLANHQQECEHRLVRCPQRGCGKFIQHRKLAEHTAVCYFTPVACPNKHAGGCTWVGLRGTMLAHMRVCEFELVTCGLGNTEDGTQSCPYRCTRREMAVHKTECEFRTVHCQFCSVAVSAVSRAAHEASCVERKQMCRDCGQMIPIAKFGEHKNAGLCARGGLVACPYTKYGCTEKLQPREMASHLRDDSHAHLRLVMHAVDTLSVNYKEWCVEVNEVKDEVVRNLKATADDMAIVHKRTANTKESVLEELENLKQQVRTMRSNHLSELAMLRTFIDNIQRKNDEKIAAVERENEHLKGVLQDVLTKESVEELYADLARFRDESQARYDDSAAAMRAHEARWAAEARAFRDAQASNTEWAESALEQIHSIMATENQNEAVRVSDMWNEITSLHKKAQSDMTELRTEHKQLVKAVEDVSADRNFMARHERFLARAEAADVEANATLEMLEPIFKARTGATPRPDLAEAAARVEAAEPAAEEDKDVPSAMAAVDHAVAVEQARRKEEARKKASIL